jgi:hypothetical protein
MSASLDTYIQGWARSAWHPKAMMNESMKDFPTSLRLSVQASHLAPAIYYCKCAVYGGHTHWDGLTPEARRIYLKLAETLLESLTPSVEGSKPTLHLVAGTKWDDFGETP